MTQTSKFKGTAGHVSVLEPVSNPVLTGGDAQTQLLTGGDAQTQHHDL